MNNKSLFVSGVIGFIIGIILSPWLGFGWWGMGHMTRGGWNDGWGNTRASMMENNIDRHFIEQMIPHHEGAIAMAKLALTKSKRPEIISLSKSIIESQQDEIDDMKEWYKDWFDTEVPTTSQHMMGGLMMSGGMHMNSVSGDLGELANAPDFDLEFIEQMIPHHEMAVMMAQMLEGSTNREEMKELADNIITSQTREIQMMRSWYEAWKK